MQTTRTIEESFKKMEEKKAKLPEIIQEGKELTQKLWKAQQIDSDFENVQIFIKDSKNPEIRNTLNKAMEAIKNNDEEAFKNDPKLEEARETAQLVLDYRTAKEQKIEQLMKDVYPEVAETDKANLQSTLKKMSLVSLETIGEFKNTFMNKPINYSTIYEISRRFSNENEKGNVENRNLVNEITSRVDRAKSLIISIGMADVEKDKIMMDDSIVDKQKAFEKIDFQVEKSKDQLVQVLELAGAPYNELKNEAFKKMSELKKNLEPFNEFSKAEARIIKERGYCMDKVMSDFRSRNTDLDIAKKPGMEISRTQKVSMDMARA